MLRDADVRCVAEQHVLVLVIDPREVPQEISNVGADPEVVEFSGVDADAHGSNDIRE